MANCGFRLNLMREVGCENYEKPKASRRRVQFNRSERPQPWASRRARPAVNKSSSMRISSKVDAQLTISSRPRRSSIIRTFAIYRFAFVKPSPKISSVGGVACKITRPSIVGEGSSIFLSSNSSYRSGSSMDSSSSRSFALPALHEYRFELEPNESITVKLVSGTAEILGLELTSAQEYHFSDELHAAIFSWHGANLEISQFIHAFYLICLLIFHFLHLLWPSHVFGKASTEYLAEESTIPVYLALHLALERSRLSAIAPKHFEPHVDPPPPLIDQSEELEDVKPGPHVMIIGSTASGKSTLFKTLANWAIKSGRTKLEGPGLLLVNLNPNDGQFTIPGSFSIAPLNVSIPTTTPVLPIGSTPTTGPPVIITPSANTPNPTPNPNPALFAPPLNALSFYYGHTQFNRNLGLAEILIKRLGQALQTRMEKSGETALWRGGVLIDTPAEFSEKAKGSLVKETVRAFGVNVLVVVGNEKLHLEISKLMSTNKTVQVVRVPKNGGATDLDLTYRRRLELSQIRSYFYGGPSLSQGQLSPFTIVVKFEDLSIFRIGDEALVPSSALPIGAVRSVNATTLTKVDPENPRSMVNVLNLVLSIPQAEWDGVDPECELAMQACSGPSLGFVHLSSIDVKNKKFTILSPLPGRLPRKVAIGGSLEWIDG
ncbi:hypothetical protein O181_049710 [Austropuccinia psidii MF-1]|uniref:Polynucleotide 5'-hydroxyl-kinase GRC3 n=1 Tax=Austropuccinia psidii MF-1 TaxID=1389203 RepID=A0A9Q3HQA7_9BASI|nr:hypothetical protein [Austropuccinia psidii MF-1]